MKVSIALDPSIDEYEILIRAPQLTEEIAQLQESILKQKLLAPLAFYKDRSEYFLDLETLLFLKQMEREFMGIPRTRPLRSNRRAAYDCLLSDFQINHCQHKADLFFRELFFGDQHG